MTLQNISQRYLELCLEADKHVPGVVDAYTGPENLRTKINQSPNRALNEILSELKELSQSTELKESSRRCLFLTKSITALHTVLRVHTGEKIPFLEESALIYDIQPSFYPESTYSNALEKLEDLVPGAGPLQPRLEEYRKQLIIPPHLVFEIFEDALQEARKRTKEFISLPQNESFDISLVKDKSWSAYNWFKGNARSLIEINIDLPRRVNQVLHLMTHEGYPGHHTDACIKEQVLVNEQGLVEYSVHPLYSPQSMIAEGIAEMALEVIFTKEERDDYLSHVLKSKLDQSHFDVSLNRQISDALNKLNSVAGNAAILLLQKGEKEEAVVDYFMKYELLDRPFAVKRTEFIKQYRGYMFTYYYGYELLKQYFIGKDVKSEFKRLLTEPVCPSSLARGSAI